MIGLPDMRPDSLAKAMTEPVKVMAPMATPSDISTRLAACDVAGRADAEGFRRVERGGRDEHRGEADEASGTPPPAPASASWGCAAR